MNMHRFLVALAVCMLIAACEKRGDELPAVAPLSADMPDSFLQYLNTQASLAAGDYSIVAATNEPARYGYYTLTITRDDGTVEVVQGAWNGSGGMDPLASGNPVHTLSMVRAGGVRIALSSPNIDGYLYLVRNGRVVAENDNSGADGSPLIDLPLSKISSADYANAYYGAVDPGEERTTLEDFRRKNCFVAGSAQCAGETIGYDQHVVFRDKLDLGYGRDMYMRRNYDGSVAFIVDNYIVGLQPGNAANYGPLNVEAAVRQDRKYYVNTTAIEFSRINQDDAASEKIAKFFAFGATGERTASVNVDGRGDKYMPGMCMTCHGGRLLPLEQDGGFPLLSLRSAKFNQLEVGSFEYSTLAGFGKSDFEEAFRIINKQIHRTWQIMQARADTEAARWHADFALDIAEGRYGGTLAWPGTPYRSYVPAGWQQTLSRPEGVEHLYTHVVEPHCIACHSLQGTQVAEEATALANAINFSSYEKFISYRETIIDYVFHRGVMPLSLRNFEDFWRDPQDKPALLASFLDEPSLFDATGQVVRPGHPVARPGDDHTAVSPVQLDGTASLFATEYRWEIVDAPDGAVATLSNAAGARPVLTADTDGDYTLELIVTGVQGNSIAETQVVTIDSALAPSQDELTFADDIAPILGTLTGSGCAGCHNSGYDGIPVVYSFSDNPNVYADVLARVNLAGPEISLLLVKPTGEGHGGGMLIDRDTVEGRAIYNTMLNWIRAGAPCGTGALCN